MKALACCACALALLSHEASALNLTPDFGWLQTEGTMQENTHNDDKLEASSETLPALRAGVGWDLGRYFEGHVSMAWRNQRAHGCNDGQCGVPKSSINGQFNAVNLMFGGAARLPNRWLTPYARLAGGPEYTWADTTRSEPGSQRGDQSGFAPAVEAAVGVERQLGLGVSARLEGGYYYGDVIRQRFVGLALVYHWSAAPK